MSIIEEEMAQNYKNKNVLKNLSFYTEEMKSVKKRTKQLSISRFDLNYHFLIKKPKKLTNNNN